MPTSNFATNIDWGKFTTSYKIYNANEIRDFIRQNLDIIKDEVEKTEKIKEEIKLIEKQTHNKKLRDRVKHVKFSGDACIVYWNDGNTTVVRWDHEEEYDPEKAILAAMAKKLYSGSNIYCEVLKKYAEDGWNHYFDYLMDNDVNRMEREYEDYVGE